MTPDALRQQLLAKLYRFLQGRESLLFNGSEHPQPDTMASKEIDLAADLALVHEAAIAFACFSQLENLNAPTQLVAQLNSRIRAYETELLRAQSEIEEVERAAQSYWSSFKAAEAELQQLRLAISNRLTES